MYRDNIDLQVWNSILKFTTPSLFTLAEILESSEDDLVVKMNNLQFFVNDHCTKISSAYQKLLILLSDKNLLSDSYLEALFHDCSKQMSVFNKTVNLVEKCNTIYIKVLLIKFMGH